MELFDPIKRSQEIENLVMEGTAKRYYRFRFATFYRSDMRKGIITADGVGCNLLCGYCWNLSRNLQPSVGRFYEPAKVAEKLVHLSEKEKNANADLYRISGCEPFLGEASARHLVAIVDAFERKEKPAGFMIESNGIMLGAMPELCNMLHGLDVHVRIAVKADSPERFEMITGAKGDAWRYQEIAVNELNKRNISCSVAIMPQFVNPLKIKFRGTIPDQLEQEQLKKYPQTVKQMKARGLVVGP
ncbi:MAG: radical SAM protein [Bacilli bacterium]|jgi:uncharacterized Fe-S cluster-containing radical SAM superfamily protein